MGFTKGEVVHCSAVFQQYINSVLTDIDPDIVFFIYKRPGLDPVTYQYGVNAQLVRDSKGHYSVNLDTTGHHGTWYFKFYSTGNGQAAQQDHFDVDKDLV